MHFKIYHALKTVILALLLLPQLLMTGSSIKRDVPILMYHAVSDEIYGETELFASPSEFYKQIKYLADNGYTPLDFSELKGCKKYKKPIIITFDDGYTDNYTNAYPIIKKFNFKATIFVIANLINEPGYLTETQIKEMSDIVSFQSHTLSHQELDKLKKEVLEKECVKSKLIIERITQKQINVISYPFGRYNRNVIDTVSLHYKYAVTTKTGFYLPGVNRFEIKRIGIMRSCKMGDFIRKLH